MISRFLERAKNRDPALEQSLTDLFTADQRDNSWAQMVNDPKHFRDVATEETRVFREYMVNEGTQQYRDYYETDAEEKGFFEYMDNFTNREKIRMMELFEDFTVDKQDNKNFIMIQKIEYNPELSVFSNMVLDLVDFKDRVRPLSNDIAMIEQTMKYQKQNVQEMLDNRAAFKKMLNDVQNDRFDKIDEGYSSAELAEPTKQTVAEPEAAAVHHAVHEEPKPVETAEEKPSKPKKAKKKMSPAEMVKEMNKKKEEEEDN